MFKSILVPVDGTSLSYKPLKKAAQLAQLGHGKLVILSVAQPRMFNSLDPKALQDATLAETIHVKAAKDNISKALDSVNSVDLPWEGVISISSMPCDAILETARRFQCDLIMMATRGKLGVIDTFFNESTTREVLSKTSIPVLVYPSN